MIKIHVCCADVARPIERPTGAIQIDKILPRGKQNYGAIFERDGGAIADVLFCCLPGGTLDQLLIEMLQRKASSFVVPHEEKRE